jgi:hypothetical protein
MCNLGHVGLEAFAVRGDHDALLHSKQGDHPTTCQKKMNDDLFF